MFSVLCYTNIRIMKNLQLSKPHFLIVIGAPRSGKSNFADRFADTFKAPYIDASMLHAPGNSVAETMKSTEYVLEQLLKTQQTIIYEGLSGSRAERLAASKLARSNGYEPLLIWIQTDLNVARARATKRSKTNTNPMTDEEFDQEVRRFTPPNTSENYVVLSGLHTYASQAKSVLKRLSATKEQSRHSLNNNSTKTVPERARSSNRSIRIQ